MACMMEQAKQRHMRFAKEYVSNGFNATEAYLSVYPGATRKSAYTAGTMLLNRPLVKKIIKDAQDKAMSKLEVTTERIMQELARIALVDIGDLLNEDGGLRKISDIPEDARRALAGLEIVELYEKADGEKLSVGDIKKIKLEGKTRALELLGKCHGMFTDNVNLSGSVSLSKIVSDLEEVAYGNEGAEDFGDLFE